MPIGMISKFARCLAEAALSRGYHSSGVAILRPSARVTTSAAFVNSTVRAFRLEVMRFQLVCAATLSPPAGRGEHRGASFPSILVRDRQLLGREQGDEAAPRIAHHHLLLDAGGG